MNSIKTNREIESNVKNEKEDKVTKDHKWGFYSYCIGFIPYALAIGTVVPTLLDLFVVKNAYALDGKSPCDYRKLGFKCVVPFGSYLIPTTSYSLYCGAISVFLQALFLILFSALADHGNWRRIFLLSFTLLGSLSATVYLAIPTSQLTAMTVLIMLAGISSAITSSFYYSYLPLLTANHPKVKECEGSKDYYQVRDLVSNRLSATSLTLGMLGCFVLSLPSLIASYTVGSGPFTLQLNCTICGICWLIVGLVGYYYLPRQEQSPLPPNSNPLTFTITQLCNSLKRTRDSFDIWICLLSWFFLSDALSTTAYVSIFVGRTELHIDAKEALLMNTFTPLVDAVAMFVIFHLKRLAGDKITTKGMTIGLAIIITLLSVWGILGNYTNVGIKSTPEILAYFTLLSMLFTVIQSFHRVMFAEIVPKGRESECFGIYLISYKGTSWIGSLTVGAIVSVSGNVRLGFFFCLALDILGIICLFLINMDRARAKAKLLAKTA